MAKTFEKAVTGFNHNIQHKGKMYHVQTEDSGVSNPHIITHVFVGGNILASRKTSYSDRVGQADLTDVVRRMMEEQHKSMLRNLVHGAYDTVDNAATRAYQPGQIDMGAAPSAPPPPKPVLPPTPIPLTMPVSADFLAEAAEGLAPLPGPTVPVDGVVPPEVLAARALTEMPAENNVGVETLFGEDLISEKSLDEVILAYLASDGGS